MAKVELAPVDTFLLTILSMKREGFARRQEPTCLNRTEQVSSRQAHHLKTYRSTHKPIASDRTNLRQTRVNQNTFQTSQTDIGRSEQHAPDGDLWLQFLKLGLSCVSLSTCDNSLFCHSSRKVCLFICLL